MLTPEQLKKIVETMQPMLDDLNIWIVRDIVKRIVKRMERGEGYELTATDIAQAETYADIGGHIEALQAQIAAYTQAAADETRRIFRQAGLTAYEADARTLRAGGIQVPTLRQSERIQEILQDVYQRTNGEMYNYTRTTAMATGQELYQVLDKAHLKVMISATSYTTAFKEAIDALAAHQAMVRYPTGHMDTLETAVLRAIRTGTGQASGNMSMGVMEEHGWEIVLTSAHLGARYGDGGENPGNHYSWQGRFFSRTGKDTRFPDFISSTGYGTGEGLCGWNCRHSFGPGDGVHNPWTQYDAEENKEAYDLSQAQRKKERDIRAQKKKVEAYKAAVETAQTDEAHNAMADALKDEQSKLARMRKAYAGFCKDNGLKEYHERLAVAKKEQEEAREAYYQDAPMGNSHKPASNEVDAGEKARLQTHYTNDVSLEDLGKPEFTVKFNGLAGSPKADAAIRDGAIEMLRHRNGTDGEDLYLFDGDTGEVLHRLTSSDKALSVRYDEETLKAIEAAHAEGRFIIAMHNHPNGLPPTLDDGSSAFVHGYDMGIVVGHNLEAWVYGKSATFVPEAVCALLHNSFAGKLKAEFDFDDQLWYTFLERSGMEVERR